MDILQPEICTVCFHDTCNTLLHSQTVSQANHSRIDLSHLTELWHLHPALPSGEVFLFLFYTSLCEDFFFFEMRCTFWLVCQCLQYLSEHYSFGTHEHIYNKPEHVVRLTILSDYNHPGMRGRERQRTGHCLTSEAGCFVLLSDVSGSIT